MRVYHSLMLLLLLFGALVLSACDALVPTGDIAALETRNAQLQGTIEVMGTPVQTIAALQQAATQAVVLEARVAQAEADALAARATLTVLELTGGGAVAAQPTSAPALPPSGGALPPAMATPSPTPSNAQTQFSQTVIATDRDQNDCPVGSNTTFNATEPLIYVFTRIDYLPAGSLISARWSVDGVLYFDDMQCWVPNQTYNNICAYCTVSPEGAAFQTGAWSVEMLLDGQVMTQAQFQIVGDPQSQQALPTDAGATTGQ